jgi:hypothetical protein
MEARAMIHVLLLAAVGVLPPCWDVFDSALRHSASAAHPPYVTYDERISVLQDGAPLFTSNAHIDYRDDGIARVSDARFNYEPFITRRTEPGPPELGPYGKGRTMWLPDENGLPTIAQIRAAGSMTCTIADEEWYKTHDTYHLVFRGAAEDRPTLKDLWVDTRSRDVWKVILTGPVSFWDDPQSTRALAEFQVELGYSGPYLVVNHVVWSLSRREYSQRVTYFGEYTYSGYSFPLAMPASYFGDDTAAFQ